MIVFRHPSKGAAFSLIEVVVAIGIVSFAVLSTFGLLSVATDTNKRSRDEQSAAQLAENEFQRIRSLSSATFPTVTYEPRYYDSDLAEVDPNIPQELARAVYKLSISWVIPAAPTPADRIFNAEVAYPANAPAANQNVDRFTALMNLPP